MTPVVSSHPLLTQDTLMMLEYKTEKSNRPTARRSYRTPTNPSLTHRCTPVVSVILLLNCGLWRRLRKANV
jgi:hypothetical protein